MARLLESRSEPCLIICEYRQLASAIVAAAALAGCGEPETPADHMQEHFTKVTEVKAAVIAGDLDAVRRPSEWLAEHKNLEALPGEWETSVEEMRGAAERVIEATDLVAAGYATASMAGTCGDCHRAINEGGHFAFTQMLPEESGVLAHMLRHQWAVDRMWEGLISPSDTLWMEGAGVLEEAALQPQGSEQITAFADRVHQLGARARESTEVGERVQIYGELLATCAQCHEALDKGPGRNQPFGRR